MNPKLNITFWVTMNQNNKIKFLFHFHCFKYLPSLFTLKEQLPLWAVKLLFLIKAAHLSDIIIQVPK